MPIIVPVITFAVGIICGAYAMYRDQSQVETSKEAPSSRDLLRELLYKARNGAKLASMLNSNSPRQRKRAGIDYWLVDREVMRFSGKRFRARLTFSRIVELVQIWENASAVQKKMVHHWYDAIT